VLCKYIRFPQQFIKNICQSLSPNKFITLNNLQNWHQKLARKKETYWSNEALQRKQIDITGVAD
jgi:hypothetical protein